MVFVLVPDMHYVYYNNALDMQYNTLYLKNKFRKFQNIPF